MLSAVPFANFNNFTYHTIGVKKPAGTSEEIEKHFGCKSSQLIMVCAH
jgi:hypothetical protein